VIDGDLGLYPGTSITGFPPGIVNGTIHDTDAVAMQAQIDALTAYNSLSAQTSTANLTGMNLGGLTLIAGVYTFNSSALLNGALTINFQGLSNQNIVFQIGSSLTTGSASAVNVINAGKNDNIYWQVGSSATLGTTSAFQGTIIADASITLNTGATINCGRAVALNAAVTMDDNLVNIDDCPGGMQIPEPATIAVLVPGVLSLGVGVAAVEPSSFAGLGLCGAIAVYRKRRKR
jgi:type VI secretion system secreted protein VgrG